MKLRTSEDSEPEGPGIEISGSTFSPQIIIYGIANAEKFSNLINEFTAQGESITKYTA